jgi:predicted DNA-binding WGR domain protein
MLTTARLFHARSAAGRAMPPKRPRRPPDLLGGALLMRQWGRIGTEGRRRLDPYPDVGAALNALAAIEREEDGTWNADDQAPQSPSDGGLADQGYGTSICLRHLWCIGALVHIHSPI